MTTSLSAEPFAGVWKVASATLPNGRFAYDGNITIEKQLDAYTLQWDISAGRYVGVGLRISDETSEHLLVACGEHYAGLGVGMFLPDEAHGGFNLRWTSAELAGAVGAGRLAPYEGAKGLEGVFQLIQRLPGGKLYGEWALATERDNAIYDVSWHRSRAMHWRGLGLSLAGGLGVCWYPDPAQLAFLNYTVTAAGDLTASWALGGFNTLGSEMLVRA